MLFVAMENDYGLPERGPGYEAHNMRPALLELGLEVRQFDYAAVLLSRGYWQVQKELEQTVRDWRPDVLFCVLYQEQIDRDVMADITRTSRTTTIGWFSDDHWRFDDYSAHWAGAFDWVVTTDAAARPKYEAVGQPNVIVSQWAANPAIYHPTGTGLKRDVSFVGQCYGSRSGYVESLRRRGFEVATFGPGWPAGRIEQDEMVDVFSSSRVNLNFSASSVGSGEGSAQIKGRAFEVAASGGLLLTDYAPGLEDYFDLETQIRVFYDAASLADEVTQLLADEERRAQIARAGLSRVLRDHTWAQRFRHILSAIGPASGGSA